MLIISNEEYKLSDWLVRFKQEFLQSAAHCMEETHGDRNAFSIYI